VPYYLVLLQPVAGAGPSPDHEPFIDWLLARNLVLVGGELDPPPFEVEAAYVLSCGSFDEAQDLVARDPLVSSGCMLADVVEWRLVGLNPAAVEPELRLGPDDVTS
jgi:hypothetical protein